MRLPRNPVLPGALLGLTTVLLCMGGFAVSQAARTNDAGARAAQDSQVADAFAGARLALAEEESAKYEYLISPSPSLKAEMFRSDRLVSKSLADAARLMPASQRATPAALVFRHQRFTGAINHMLAAVITGQRRRALTPRSA